MKVSKHIELRILRQDKRTQGVMNRAIGTLDPATVLVNALCHYAESYDGDLGADGYCGPAWLEAAHAACQLLSGPGKFDGGTLDGALRDTARSAGFTEEETDTI